MNKNQIGGTSNKAIGSSCAANGSACVFSTKRNNTAALAFVHSYGTGLCMTCCEARLNIVNWCLQWANAGQVDRTIVLSIDGT